MEKVEELESLRRSDARYRSLLQVSAEVVWVASPGGELMERQPSWEQYTGLTWDEYQYSKWISAIHPQDRARVVADWASAVKSGGPVYRTQGRIWSAKHKAWRAFQTRGAPVRDPSGAVIEWVGALNDVQDVVDVQDRLKAGERAAAQLRGRLRTLLESNIVGISTATDRGITEANDAFLRLVGRSADELEGGTLDWRAMTPIEHVSREESALRELDANGECAPIEKEYVRPDGTRVPVLIGRVLLNRDPREWVNFVIDITQQKKVEAALVTAREAAERANEDKTRFLAAASHDLRQPLQALAAIVSQLAKRTSEPSTAALIARADRAIAALADLLNALLDFSQLHSGLVRPNLEEFPVARILETMRNEFEFAASEKGLSLTVQGCEDWVRSDPVLLTRIVRNLLSNAIKFTSSGGWVKVSCGQREGLLAIAVADNGDGIPRELHAKVFEEFRQLANPERDSRKGLGLGLSTAAKMAELLQHELVMGSEPGAGSTFKVITPQAEPRAGPAPRPRAIERSRRVLLVDDNVFVVESMSEVLVAAGHDVVACDSVAAALERIGESEAAFDSVISDYRFPRSSGLDVIEAFRRRWPDRSAIILSGDIFDPKLHALGSSSVRVLRKPVDWAELAQAIEGDPRGARPLP